MYKTVFWAINNQKIFFKYYFIVVALLIIWSAFEGVFDIEGTIFLDLIVDGKVKTEPKYFKAGYFTSLNYGIYYITFLPIFLKFVFETYKAANALSNLETIANTNNDEFIVQVAIKEYSSKIVRFLQEKKSILILVMLFMYFSAQNIVVEWNDYKKLSLGWVQGMRLKSEFGSDTVKKRIDNKTFYFRDEDDLTKPLRRFKSHTVTEVSFTSKRIPNQYEFITFITTAKLFFCCFTTIVFFFNINVLFGLIWFLMDSNKKILFKSAKFVETMDQLITNISVAGGSLSVFLFFRYITNYKKGSFKAFDSSAGILGNDQYIFVFGTMFIPITVTILFVYLITSNAIVTIGSWSVKRVFTLYLPSIAFLCAFLIYLANFDHKMYDQLKFILPALQWVNGIFM